MLSDLAIKAAKSKSKQYRLADEKGLYLLIRHSGKLWRFDYRINGIRKTISLGSYPETSLAAARKKRDEARAMVQAEVDPSKVRQEEKQREKDEAQNTFEGVARKWFGEQSKIWSARHADSVIKRLEYNVFPFIGVEPIASITPKNLKNDALQRILDRGAIETAHRVKQICGQVFQYGMENNACEQDPAAAVKLDQKPTVKHMGAVTKPREIGALLRAIDGYEGQPTTKYALQIAALTFVRPGELRQAEWSEFDFEEARWTIPSWKMKLKKEKKFDSAYDHIVPLSRQAIKILKKAYDITGDGKYVFPSMRSNERPMSNNTMLGALRRLGYGAGEMTAHGFRAMASTRLYEDGALKFSEAVIETQLAHMEGNKVKAAYNRATYLDARRGMMQKWADYLDAMRDGGKVIPFRESGGRIGLFSFPECTPEKAVIMAALSRITTRCQNKIWPETK